MFHVIINANSIVQHVIQNKNWIMINAKVSLISIVHAKKIIVGILAHLKCIVDDSVIVCDETVNVTDIISTNVTSTISKSVTSTVPVNSDDKT